MFKRTVVLLSAFILFYGFVVQRAEALTSFDVGNVSDLTSDAVKSLIKIGAIGADHRAYAPAGPLGYVIGLDASIDGTFIQLPDEVVDAMKLATDQPDISAGVFLPKLNIRKGLPWGVDFGFSYIAYQGYRIIGVDAQWALVTKAILPVVALRASQNYVNLFFMKTRSTKVDVIASKKLGFIFEPYLGAGVQIASGELDVPLGGGTGLPLTISGSDSFTTGHVFVGLPIKLVFTKLTAEYDYSFTGLSTYGFKVGFSF